MNAEPTTFLPSRAPLAYGRALAYFARRAGELVDTSDGGRYRRVLLLNGGPTLIEAEEAPSTTPGLLIRVLSGPSESLPAAAAALRQSFGLDDDLLAFYATVAADPPLAALTSALEGLRLIRTQSPFEALVWAIIGQQINLTLAFRLKASLVRRYGSRLEYAGVGYWGFLTPETLAAADPDTLVPAGFSRRKAETIIGVAQRVVRGGLELQTLPALTRQDAEVELLRSSGVGPWTAHYTMLRGLGDFGAFPQADLGLRVAAARMYGTQSPAPAAFMRQLGERWGEWRGYAAFYLWNALGQRAG